jgi:hypothetical protein
MYLLILFFLSFIINTYQRIAVLDIEGEDTQPSKYLKQKRIHNFLGKKIPHKNNTIFTNISLNDSLDHSFGESQVYPEYQIPELTITDIKDKPVPFTLDLNHNGNNILYNYLKDSYKDKEPVAKCLLNINNSLTYDNKETKDLQGKFLSIENYNAYLDDGKLFLTKVDRVKYFTYIQPIEHFFEGFNNKDFIDILVYRKQKERETTYYLLASQIDYLYIFEIIIINGEIQIKYKHYIDFLLQTFTLPVADITNFFIFSEEIILTLDNEKYGLVVLNKDSASGNYNIQIHNQFNIRSKVIKMAIVDSVVFSKKKSQALFIIKHYGLVLFDLENLAIKGIILKHPYLKKIDFIKTQSLYYVGLFIENSIKSINEFFVEYTLNPDTYEFEINKILTSKVHIKSYTTDTKNSLTYFSRNKVIYAIKRCLPNSVLAVGYTITSPLEVLKGVVDISIITTEDFGTMLKHSTINNVIVMSNFKHMNTDYKYTCSYLQKGVYTATLTQYEPVNNDWCPNISDVYKSEYSYKIRVDLDGRIKLWVIALIVALFVVFLVIFVCCCFRKLRHDKKHESERRKSKVTSSINMENNDGFNAILDSVDIITMNSRSQSYLFNDSSKNQVSNIRLLKNEKF